KVPRGATAAVLTVSVEDCGEASAMTTVPGAKAALVFPGKPPRLKPTLPIKPAAGVTVTVYVVVSFGMMLREGGSARTTQSGAQERKVYRRGVPDHVDLPGGIERDTVATVAAAAAQVTGVQEHGSGDIQFQYECVRATAVVRLERVLGREIARGGFPRDIDIASGVERNAITRVETAATQQGRADESRA